jgi:hypothetical protein
LEDRTQAKTANDVIESVLADARELFAFVSVPLVRLQQLDPMRPAQLVIGDRSVP